jgi:hypothetical protein
VVAIILIILMLRMRMMLMLLMLLQLLELLLLLHEREHGSVLLQLELVLRGMGAQSTVGVNNMP